MTGSINSCAAELGRVFNTRPEAPALIDSQHGGTWTFGQLDELTRRAAGFLLARRGQAEGPVVALLPNAVDTLVLYLATLRAGIGFAPLTPQASLRDLDTWLKMVKPGLLIHSLSSSEIVESSGFVDRVPAVSIVPNGQFDWLKGIDAVDTLEIPRLASPLLLATSGTTGEPKVLVLDSDRLWSAGRAFARHHDFIDPNCRFFNVLPMSYLGGLFNLGLIPLTRGCSIAIGEVFSGKSFVSFWQDVERLGVNVLWIVPAIVRGLLSFAKRSKRRPVDTKNLGVRACFLGTAPIDSAAKSDFEQEFGIPVLENFGLSETTFISSETLGSRYHRRDGSVGEILPYVEVSCRPIAPEDAGPVSEIEVKTPYLFLGYLQTDGTIVPPEGVEGRFSTGDLGRVVDGGTLIYEGRTRDIIKKGGYLIALREVEVLAEQHPHVEEAVAVPVPHDFYGEDYALVLRLLPTCQVDAGLSELRIWVNKNLAQYKWPTRILIRDDFPRTVSGKVRKAVLSEELKVS